MSAPTEFRILRFSSLLLITAIWTAVNPLKRDSKSEFNSTGMDLAQAQAWRPAKNMGGWAQVSVQIWTSMSMGTGAGIQTSTDMDTGWLLDTDK